MPAIFVTDFGPFPAIEIDGYTDALSKLGRELPLPKAILIMSGHWETRGPLGVSSAKKPGVIHDYSGFPKEYYSLNYPCPGDPALAEEIVKILSVNSIDAKSDSKRSLDHGAWVPLSRLYPKANIPVVQLSVPREEPQKIYEIGRVLSVFREQQVLLVGAGALSHNLRLALVNQKNDPPDEWVISFNAWIQDKLEKGMVEELFNYRKLAPSANLAAPTPEHFDPLFFMLGVASGDRLQTIHQSIRYGNGLMKIIQSVSK
jgi:4,5-DOPA dioxygenase extradiol